MNLRARVVGAIPKGAFLRRDRGDAMYVTNAPVFGGMGDVPGFHAETRGSLMYLYIRPETIEEFDHAPDALANELTRFRGSSPAAAVIFTEIMKNIEALDAGAYAALNKKVRQSAALAMRLGGGEGLYYCALALARLREIVT